MRSRYVIIGGAAAVVLGLAAVSAFDSTTVQPAGVQDDRITVFASFFPYYEFTRNVAGDLADVKQYLPSGIEAHDWEPSVGAIRALQDADVFVYNGLGMEPYVQSMLDSGELDHVHFVRAADGADLLTAGDPHAKEFLTEILHEAEELKAGASESRFVESVRAILDEHEGDGHDHGTGLVHDIERLLQDVEDGRTGGIEEILHLASGDDGNFDPHIWLDPVLAKRQVDNIRDGLSRADPGNAEHYERNAAQYNAKLDVLDAKIRAGLSDCKGDTIVPFHNSFAYLGKRYGLTVFSIGGLAPDAEATAFEISGFIDHVRENSIGVIFAEELVDPRLAQVIADEAGAQVMVLSPIEAQTRQEADAGVTFLYKMEQNLDVLRTALECQ